MASKALLSSSQLSFDARTKCLFCSGIIRLFSGGAHRISRNTIVEPVIPPLAQTAEIHAAVRPILHYYVLCALPPAFCYNKIRVRIKRQLNYFSFFAPTFIRARAAREGERERGMRAVHKDASRVINIIINKLKFKLKFLQLNS